MANICTSNLFVRGPKDAIQRFKDVASCTSEDGRSLIHYIWFQHLVPPPDWSDPKWFTDNWGCQHESGADKITQYGGILNGDHVIEYEIETSWSPPVGVIRGASEMFPDILFIMSYEEDSYFGQCRFKAGIGMDVTLDRQGPNRWFDCVKSY